jgi:hypothetical protein
VGPLEPCFPGPSPPPAEAKPRPPRRHCIPARPGRRTRRRLPAPRRAAEPPSPRASAPPVPAPATSPRSSWPPCSRLTGGAAGAGSLARQLLPGAASGRRSARIEPSRRASAGTRRRDGQPADRIRSAGHLPAAVQRRPGCREGSQSARAPARAGSSSSRSAAIPSRSPERPSRAEGLLKQFDESPLFRGATFTMPLTRGAEWRAVPAARPARGGAAMNLTPRDRRALMLLAPLCSSCRPVALWPEESAVARLRRSRPRRRRRGSPACGASPRDSPSARQIRDKVRRTGAAREAGLIAAETMAQAQAQMLAGRPPGPEHEQQPPSVSAQANWASPGPSANTMR